MVSEGRRKRDTEGHKVLVCGGRDYEDEANVFRTLDDLHRLLNISLLVQGYATGADRIAHQWAESRGVDSTGEKYKITKSMWDHWGKAAGPIRNHAMYDEELPDMVVGFPGGSGTAGMLEYAREKGCPVVVTVSEEGELRW